MCTKHEACRCKGHVMAKESCCSSPVPGQIKSIGTRRESCSSAEPGSCCGGSDPAEEDAPPQRDSSYTQSWKIAGMDCPSCAKKIETAVSNIEGVVNARVLFSTEKLVVNFNHSSLAQTIENVASQSGFPLNADLSQKQDKQKTGVWGAIRQNVQLITLAIAMAVSIAVRPILPQFSQWAFVIICLVGLLPIAGKALHLARSGTPFSIETLMSVAALGALYLGESVEAAMVLLLFLLGEKLEAYASYRARSGVRSLMRLIPEEAVRIVDGERRVVAATELAPGDIIEVAPGSRIPADGITQTAASFDESALTGESLPVTRNESERVMAGSVVVDRVVRLRITSRQGENAIDRILHLIEEAESHKAPVERFMDRFSRWYTPMMMLLAVLVIITPPLLFAQPWETWVYRGLALLLIACPCALVISTPAAITSGLAVAAKRGALIKGGAALEQLGRIELVAFDKTGTLTKGEPRVTDVISLAAMDEMELLQKAAAIEVGSTHPLAVSLIDYAHSFDLVLPEAGERRAMVGIGVSGQIAGTTYQIVAPDKAELVLEERVSHHLSQLEEMGKTTVVVLAGGAVAGIIAWQDTVREDAGEAVGRLGEMGIGALMLTGDNARSAKSIGDTIGIDFEAGLMPDGKVGFVSQLSRDKRIAMVGDGINDAPAMKAASVGIAMGSGTDVALEAADAALTHNRLIELADIIRLSQATLNNIRQNVALAIGLKGVFLVTSLLGITGLWVAVLADSGATVLVTANALRLLRFRSR